MTLKRPVGRSCGASSMWRWLAVLGGGVVAAAAGLAADGPPADKTSYHLFNPTPRDLMREMNTDRPDKTESPITVDAGHVQVELDFFTYTHDHSRAAGEDVRTDIWEVAPVNLKVGLMNSVDLQLVLQTHRWVRVEDRHLGRVDRESGFGDVTTRVKMNFWGNDGGPTALAAMPYATFLTGSQEGDAASVEGGLIVPLSIDLPMGWGMTLMSKLDILRNDLGDGNHANFVHSATFGHTIVGDLAGYAEFYSEVSTVEGEGWVGTVDVGLTYGLTRDIQIDTGVNLGVTEAADDVNTFVGISVRF